MALIDALDEFGLNGKAHSPWYFPTATTYAARLEKHGFKVTFSQTEPVIRYCPPQEDMGGWFDTFGASFSAACRDDNERQRVRQRSVERLTPVLRSEDST
jgi:hypothetical protein